MTKTAWPLFFVLFVVINAQSLIHASPSGNLGVPPSSLPGFGNPETVMGEGNSLKDQAVGDPDLLSQMDEGFGYGEEFGEDEGFDDEEGFGDEEGPRGDEGFGYGEEFGEGEGFDQGRKGFGREEEPRGDEGFGYGEGFRGEEGFGGHER
jgi:hypothetical protein